MSDMYTKYIKTYKTQCQKKPKQFKVGRRHEQTFLQRHTDNQQTHEKMLNSTHHQGNANQNHNELSCHTCQNG